MTPAPPPSPSGPEPSWIARVAPSWTFEGHRIANGHALVACLLGFVSGVFISVPGGSLVVLGVLIAVPCVAMARIGRRRAAEHPWMGGSRLATSGPVMVGLGVGLALVWLLTGP